MTIYAPTESGSHTLGIKQSEIFKELDKKEERLYAIQKQDYFYHKSYIVPERIP